MDNTTEDFEPYHKEVKSIVIQQLTQSGWVDLIRMPIGDSKSATPIGVQRTIEYIQSLFYKADKVELAIQGSSIAVRGISNGGTFRVCASYTAPEEPFTVP